MNTPRNRITALSGAGVGHTHDRRRLATRVLDLTLDLVGLVARCEWTGVGRLLVERRCLLERLSGDPAGAEDENLILALRGAVAESDRTVVLLLANAELRWSAAGGRGD